MKISSTYTAVFVYPRWGPNWRTTVDKLTDLADINLAIFIDKNIFTQHLLVFEVMGKSADVEWFVKKLRAEDRKCQCRLYENWVEHD